MKVKLKSKFFTGESKNVLRGMFTLLVGAGLARIVGLVSIPILTRLYSPEDFGVLALYTALVTILAPALTLRYVQAIPLPKTDEMAFNLFTLCFKLIIVGSLIFSLVLLLLGESILAQFDMQELFPWWWLIVLGTAGTALYELFNLWATRKKQYITMAKAQFSQSVIGNIAKIIFGLLAIKPAGLIVGQFLSQSAGISGLVKLAGKDCKKYYPKFKKSREKLIAKYYQQFVWYRLPSQFLMVLSVQAPVIMMASLYGKELTGQLSLAIMALSLPVGLVGQAMAKAYYAEIAFIGKNDPEKIKRITFDIQKKLFVAGIPIAVIIYFASEWIFLNLFGEEWGWAGRYASLLAPFILFQFTSSPLMEVINVLGMQFYFLILHSVRMVGFALIFYYSRGISSYDFVLLLSGYLSFFYLTASLLVVALLTRKSFKS